MTESVMTGVEHVKSEISAAAFRSSEPTQSVVCLYRSSPTERI